MYIYTNRHMYTTYMHTHIQYGFIHRYVHISIYIQVHRHIYTPRHVCLHAYIYIHTIYTSTQTHFYIEPLPIYTQTHPEAVKQDEQYINLLDCSNYLLVLYVICIFNDINDKI